MQTESRAQCLHESFTDHPTTHLSADPRGPEEGVRNRSILLVDDTPEVLEVLRYFLIRAGFEVVASSSATDALRLGEDGTHRFGLLIADLRLGSGLSGLQLAEALLRQNPNLSVIYISGARADLWDPAVFVEGVNYLPKPFSPAALVKIAGERLA